MEKQPNLSETYSWNEPRSTEQLLEFISRHEQALASVEI